MAKGSGNTLTAGGSSFVGSGGHGSPFAKKLAQHITDFSGGLNNKFSPLLIADNELADIQNFNFDEKGTLQKRLGFTKRYAVPFATGAVRGLTNYRKEDGTSRLVIAADDKWFYDKPQFNQAYAAQADWETTGTQRVRVDTATTPGTVTMMRGGSGLGAFGLGSRWASLGGALISRQSIWQSQNLDISAVQDKTTGTVTTSVSAPTGTSVTIETRYSTDQTNWSAWTGLGAGNSIQSVGANTWLQARARFNSTNRMRPSMTSLSVKFDITATVTTITTGLSTSARWSFVTMNDILYGVDGVDTNKKWDGTTFGTMGGTPPTCSLLVVHKNRMFLAGQTSTNRSRLYFSDIQNPESWPVLNFIDVGKGDGDAITGLAILNDNLCITKDHSVWLLQGDSSSNFILRRATDEAGAVTGFSFGGVVKQVLPMLARDGVYFFDGVRTVLASEKITKSIQACNQRLLNLAAAAVTGIGYTKKYWLSLPEGASTSNSVIFVFDSLRSAWTVYRGIAASEFVIFRQFNADTLIFGSTTTGQVYQAETGYNDNGAAIDAYFVTKAFDMNEPEVLRLGRRILADGREPQGQTTTAQVSFIKDLGTETASQTVTFVRPLEVVRALPGVVGIGTFHSLAVKVRHNIVNQGLNVYGLMVEFIPKGIRPTR